MRKRASGNYSLVFQRKGKTHLKAFGTADLDEAEPIKQYAEAELARIRKAENALDSQLLADGHSIADGLFGSGHLGQH